MNLASVMVDKYLFFDNPVFQKSETKRPISDFQLKKPNNNNVYLHKTSHPSFQNNEFNRVKKSLNESYIISPQQYVSKDLLKTHQKVSKTPKS